MEIRNIKYHNDNAKFQIKKKEVEEFIRSNYQDVKNLDIIVGYNVFFKKFGKVYPIQYQVQSVVDGKELPSTVKAVEAMLMSELTSLFLTAGHDLDKIEGNMTVELTAGNEQYIKINQKEQTLKADDIICRDDVGVISSVLYGPDSRTKITKNTSNCLFFSYFPYSEDDENIKAHFNAILSYIELIAEKELLTSVISIVQ